MSNWTIYYNPKCGTCRKALELLKSKKIEPRLIEYLKSPPTVAELEAIAGKLGDRWFEMVRTKEPVYGELKLSETTPKKDILAAIARNAILLQRPIIIKDNRAVVARPPEKVEALF